jgi:hypothetical protein
LFLILPTIDKSFKKLFTIFFLLAPYILAAYVLIVFLSVDGCPGEEGMKLFLAAALIIFIIYPFEYVIDTKIVG